MVAHEAGSVGPYGAALIGALGAVVGGVLTVTGNLLIEWSRGKTAARAREASEQRAVRQATRVLLEESSGIQSRILHSARTGLTWRADEPLPVVAWTAYRDHLAAQVSDEAWRHAASAYNAVASLNEDAADLRREHMTDERVHFTETAWLRRGLKTITAAMPVLQREAGPMAGIFKYTGYVGLDEVWPEGKPKPR